MFILSDFGQDSFWADLFILKMIYSFDLKHHCCMTLSRGGEHTSLLTSTREPKTGKMIVATSGLVKR